MANEPTIENKNETIGIFDGWEFLPGFASRLYKKNGKTIADCDFKYHTSWDWLMPVVEKIEAMHDKFHGYFGVHISSNGCTIQGTKFNTTPGKEHYAYFNDVTHETKILATHYMVYQFITWYNQQKQKYGNP